MNFIKLQEFIKNLTNDGVIRRVDELGRVVIPVEYRKESFKEGEEIYVFRIEDYIILSKSNFDNTALIKRIDEAGRVVIKKEFRTDLDWNEKDAISVWSFEDFIIMKKYEEKCVFCKTTLNLIEFKEKLICDDCKGKLIKAS